MGNIMTIDIEAVKAKLEHARLGSLREDISALLDEVERLRAAMPSAEEIKDLDWILLCIDEMGSAAHSIADEYNRVSSMLTRLDAARKGNDQ